MDCGRDEGLKRKRQLRRDKPQPRLATLRPKERSERTNSGKAEKRQGQTKEYKHRGGRAVAGPALAKTCSIEGKKKDLGFGV